MDAKLSLNFKGATMKTDLFTKAILTVIAVALVWIAVNMMPAVSAGPDVIQVDIVKIDGRPLQYKPLPVQFVKNDN